MVIFGRRFVHKGKKYIMAGFGVVSMKAFLIKRNTKGEFIVFNGKTTFLK